MRQRPKAKAQRGTKKTPPPPPKSMPKDGIALDSPRGNQIVLKMIEWCGMAYYQVQVVAMAMEEFQLSRRQAYRYYDAAWSVIAKESEKDHAQKVQEARAVLSGIIASATKEKRYQEAGMALDRRNLIDNVSNPTSSQKVTVINPTSQVDDDASDEELTALSVHTQRILANRKRDAGGSAPPEAKGGKA